VFALPTILVRDIKRTELMVIDSLLWARDKRYPESMVDKIEDLKEETADKKDPVCYWPPRVLAPAPHEPTELDYEDMPEPNYPTPQDESYADYRCVSYLLRRVLKIADDRIHTLCSFLGIPTHLRVAHLAWVAFRYILRRHIYLLYDRHIDHWLLCCLYGVCKATKYDPNLTFSRIIDAYVVIRAPEMGDVTCQRIVRHIKIMDAAQQPVGDIIYLYNQVFLWKVHKQLLHTASVAAAAALHAGVKITVNSHNAELRHTEEALRGRTDKAGTQVILDLGKPMSFELVQTGGETAAPSSETMEVDT
jgi:hypothetical protein